MKKKINNKLIRSFSPCYDPINIVISDKESLSVLQWIQKYRSLVRNNSDIIWLICRKEFMSDRDLRLFAVWCARETLKLQENIDPRSTEACNVAERYANGDATDQELSAAWSAAESAARSAARSATESAARSAARSAWSAAESAAESAARSAAQSAAESAAWSAAQSAWSTAESAWSAAESAAWSAQIDKLLTYFIS